MDLRLRSAAPRPTLSTPTQISYQGQTTGTLTRIGSEPEPIDTETKDAALRQLKTASKEMLAALADGLIEDARRAGATEQEIWDAITR